MTMHWMRSPKTYVYSAIVTYHNGAVWSRQLGVVYQRDLRERRAEVSRISSKQQRMKHWLRRGRYADVKFIREELNG